MKRHHFLICLLLIFTLAGCGGTSAPSSTVTLNVFAAASLTEVFNEIKVAYQQQHSDITLTYNFAGSQALVQQIEQGATVDIFASADLTTMQKVEEASLVNESQIFARNKLVVIVPVTNPGGINSLQDLAKEGVTIDVAAETVPVGKYTREVLAKMEASSEYGPDYVDRLNANIVSQEDNVKAVVQKVQLGEVDAGFVYQTDVTGTVATDITTLSIPDTFNVVAEYPIAVSKQTAYTQEAEEFVAYILAHEGQAFLERYGFVVG